MTSTYIHIGGTKKVLGSGRLRLELAVEHILYIFLLLMSFLRGKDFKNLDNPFKSLDAVAKREKDTHFDRGIKTQCFGPLPSLHTGGTYAWAVLVRPGKNGEGRS